MVATHGEDVAKTCHLTTEAGVIGGSPVGGLLFGAARNATALMPAASIIDFYQGGGCDLAVLGMAEVSSMHLSYSYMLFFTIMFCCWPLPQPAEGIKDQVIQRHCQGPLVKQAIGKQQAMQSNGTEV